MKRLKRSENFMFIRSYATHRKHLVVKILMLLSDFIKIIQRERKRNYLIVKWDLNHF